MRIAKQLNVAPVVESPLFPDWFRTFLERYTQQAKRTAESLTGPTLFNQGALHTPATVALKTADVVAATLIGDTAITVALTRAGDEGMLELMQDGVGSHVVTWANVVWTNGTPPTVAAGAGKRTLLGFTQVSATEWLGRVVGTNF